MRSLELEQELIQAYADTFISRWDLYPIQRPDDGSYVSVKKPLTLDLVYSHLTRHWQNTKPITLGAYALSPESTAKWVCLDADDGREWEEVWRLAQDLKGQGIPSYPEGSRRGGHLWLFFQSPIAAKEARAFGKFLLNTYDLPDLEIYPKQDRLGDGPGSLVRLPLGIHQKTGRVHYFFDLAGQPLAPRISQQIERLANPERVPQSFVEDVLWQDYLNKRHHEAEDLELIPDFPEMRAGETLSDAIKNTISVYDLVSQYVDLDRQGRGLCPFHDDQVKSFGVNVEKNYWSCFAGCGGGSVIDFMMRWRDTHGEDGSFTATIMAMREMFL